MAGSMREFLVLLSSFAVLSHHHSVNAANVLVSSIYGEGSHFLAASAVSRSLVERGHNVTFLISRAYEHRAVDPKYANFSFEIFEHDVPLEQVRDSFSSMPKYAFVDQDLQIAQLMQAMLNRTVEDCGTVLRNTELMSKLEVMDAIVMDVSWPCGLLIRKTLQKDRKLVRNLTMVALLPTPPWRTYLSASGSGFNFASQPELTTGLSNRMTFKGRLKNMVMSMAMYAITVLYLNKPYKEIERDMGLTSEFDALASYNDFDLFLMNIDFASDFAIPLAPHVIPVGGLTATPASPLGQELEDFMQSSGEDGVVVFTLGTYLASITTFRPEIVEMFAEAFAKLPQKVLWQLKELPDWELPPNVKTMPWLPQNDLLGHPKTRVLMWQGGNNGFQEACYHGVPAVVIPLQGDQYDIAARVEARGLGKKIDKSDLGADIIYRTLTEVINNPSYTKVAKQVSAIYHDQPMSAPDRAAFWIEHVIKFGGSYMRSPANDLNFIQYHLIDVYAFLTAIVVFILAVVYYILRFCLSICCRVLGRGGSTKSKTD